jgi:hypothetical protein
MSQSQTTCVREGCTNPIQGAGLYCSAHMPKATDVNRFSILSVHERLGSGSIAIIVFVLLFALGGLGALVKKILTFLNY